MLLKEKGAFFLHLNKDIDMSIFARGLVAAMEDETNAAELAIGEAGADSAEADLVEATDISADVEAGTTEVEQATADADTLGRIADTAEAAEDDGGLDPVAAEIAEIAVEAIYARLGVSRTSYPALESFSGKSGRQRATRYAVEDMKETVKKIWAAVVNAFQKIIDFVKNLFSKLFDGNRKLLARINALENKANATTKTIGGKVNGSGITKATGADNLAHVLHAVASAPVELKKIHDYVSKTVADLSDVTSDIAQSATKETSFLDQSKSISDLYNDCKNASAGLSKDGVISKRIEVKFEPKEGDKKSMWESITGFGVTIKEATGFGEKTELDALSINELKKVLKDARSVVMSNLEQKANVAKFESGIRKAIENSKRIAEQSSTTGEEKSSLAEDSRIAQRAITAVGNSSIKMFTFAGKVGTEIAKAGIDYAERSLGNAGVEDKKVDKSKEKK